MENNIKKIIHIKKKKKLCNVCTGRKYMLHKREVS